MTRSILRTILEHSDYEVIAEVGTAMEALQLASTYKPDVSAARPRPPGDVRRGHHSRNTRGRPTCTVIVVSSFNPTAAIHAGALYVVPKGETKQLDCDASRRSSRQATGGVPLTRRVVLRPMAYVFAFDHKHRKPPMSLKDLLGRQGRQPGRDDVGTQSAGAGRLHDHDRRVPRVHARRLAGEP